MNISSLLKHPTLRPLINRLDTSRVSSIISKITPHLQPEDTIIDIGCGFGFVSHTLQEKGFKVTSVDVRDVVLVDEVHPVIYDGVRLPFSDKSFDCALLITVLHHTPHPELILQEAKRVAKKVIVMEDIYEGDFHKYATYMMDSVVNLEFLGHPHSNKDDQGWRQTFENIGLDLRNAHYEPFWKVYTSATYCLQA